MPPITTHLIQTATIIVLSIVRARGSLGMSCDRTLSGIVQLHIERRGAKPLGTSDHESNRVKHSCSLAENHEYDPFSITWLAESISSTKNCLLTSSQGT